MTTSDQESSSDIAVRLVALYREVARAAAETYHHAKQTGDLFEIDPVHPGDLAALSKARAAENGWRSLTNSPPAFEATYRSDPVRKSNGSLPNG
jgi:hypothetical protein